MKLNLTELRELEEMMITHQSMTATVPINDFRQLLNIAQLTLKFIEARKATLPDKSCSTDLSIRAGHKKAVNLYRASLTELKEVCKDVEIGDA